jgi:tRNA threonylcarbamoyladenosine biosynthesis protein TsaE
LDSFVVSTKGPESTAAVATLLAPHLRRGDVVLLQGGLATGKTMFVKAIASALGFPGLATSPTFTLAHFYPSGSETILHIDAYRLSGIHEYRDLGLDEYVDESITLVEWGEKIADDFPCHLMIEFHCEASAPNLRVLRFSSGCRRWESVINALQAELLDGTKLT